MAAPRINEEQLRRFVYISCDVPFLDMSKRDARQSPRFLQDVAASSSAHVYQFNGSHFHRVQPFKVWPHPR
eukprot:3360703-Pleurochrysis_carterae.AAC.1